MRLFTYYLPWLTPIVIIYTIHAYYSYLNNIFPGNYKLQLYLTGIIPIWTFMSMYSKNPTFDGILVDVVVLLTYAVAMNIFANKGFTFINWAGLLVVVLGILMVKK